MPKDFNEYKKNQMIKKSYEEAGKIQEALALTVVQPKNKMDDYKGHIAVYDILNKIDAMVRMFENCMRDNEYSESSSKIIEITCNLYDLAQIKLAEAKKQARSYMEKASGTTSNDQSVLTDIEDEPEPEPEPEDDGKIKFNTRGPTPSPEEPEDAVPPEPIE